MLQRFAEDDLVVAIGPEIANARFFVSVAHKNLPCTREGICARRFNDQKALQSACQMAFGGIDQCGAQPFALKVRLDRKGQHNPCAIRQVFRNCVAKPNGLAVVAAG